MLSTVKDLKWLYFDLNSYFATIEQQVDPSIRKKPVVVVPLLTDYTCAIAASYEAKLIGIKTGTKIYEAKKIYPELICRPAQHQLYVKYHKLIFAEINKLLYIDHVCSIDEGAGRLTGKYQQEEEAILLAQNIKQAIKDNVGDYITCSIGIAPNKYLAKIAAEMKKPDGLTVIRDSDIPNKLFSMTLRDIPGVGYKMHNRLHLANIDNVEKLYECSSGKLQAIWGSVHGKKLWYLLRGHELSEYAVQNRMMGHSRILAPELRNAKAARDVAIELIQKAAKRLRNESLYSTAIGLYLKTVNKVVYKTYVKITPTCDSTIILTQLLNIWDRLVRDNKINNLYQVSVALSGLIEKPRQLTFEELNTLPNNKISSALDIINNKYGKSIISIGMLPTPREQPIAFANIPGAEGKEYLN